MTDYTSPTERIAIALEKIAEGQRRQTEASERAAETLKQIAAALRDDEEEVTEKPDRGFEGMIDYRQDDEAKIPAECPVCEGKIERSLKGGDVVVEEPIPAWATAAGIVKPGRYTTIGWKWRCVSDPAHRGAPRLWDAAGLVPSAEDLLSSHRANG